MLLADLPVVTPDAVLHLPQDITPGGRCWWLLWTESTREKRLMAALGEAGAVPLVVTNTRAKKRKNGAGRDQTDRRDVNLFTGYLFANGTDIEVYKAKDKQWAEVVRVGQQARTIQQIARVMEISASQENLTVEKLAKGQKVEVRRGPFIGKEAIVVEDELGGRVCLEVEIFNRMVPTEIAVEDVEVV
jgi:transcription antitermination factor NusG